MPDSILFLCGCYPNPYHDEYVENSIGLSQIAADKLQKNIIHGISELTSTSVFVLTAPFVGYYPKGYRAFLINSHDCEDKEAKYKVVGFINIKGIETFIKAKRLYREIIKWYDDSDENRNIIVYSHYAGFMTAVGKVKREHSDLKTCCIITDMPELSKPKMTICNALREIPSRVMFAITYRNLKYIDNYVLLTAQMADSLAIPVSRYCRVECMSNPSKTCIEVPKYLSIKQEETIVFAYTGTLDVQYGIKDLIGGFTQIEDPRFRLWICGDGNGRNIVENAVRDNQSIKYFGVLNSVEVTDLQDTVDILVNPRSANSEFTKYSFPSKTIEYMLAGKPVICYKLAGIPDEYDDYLYYFPEPGIQGIIKGLMNIGHLSTEELNAFGNRNRRYATEEKNYRKQTGKILDLMGISHAI